MYKINQTAAFFLQISFIQVSLSLLFLGDRFFFRNINWSTCSGLSRLRLEETISPAVLNTRSDATLVAGIQRYFLARDDSQWQVLLLFPPLQWVFLQGQQITHSVPLDFFVGLVSYRSSSHPHFKVFSQQLVQRWHFLLFERRVIIWNRKQFCILLALFVMTQWHFFSTCLYHFIYEPSSDVQNEFILALLFTSVKVVLSSSLLYSFSLHADYLIALNLLLYANILWLHEFKPKSTLSWSQVIKYTNL